MTAIVFETKGLIDIHAFTTMGLSSKPNSTTPIGQFGTGLKYAIAVLVRNGIEPVLWIGRDKYTFYKKAISFRTSAEYDLVCMKLEKWNWRKPRYTELSFTTQYGKFWKLWQAYRELEANTRDEGGTTRELLTPIDQIRGIVDTTLLVIDNEEFLDVYKERDKVFLPQASSNIKESDVLEVFDGESEYIYYRGMRVAELSRPSLYTYNLISGVELTEDRTLKYSFQAEEALGRFAAKSENGEFLNRILCCDDDWWEASIDFTGYRKVAPGETFRSVVKSAPSGLRSKAMEFYSQYERPIATDKLKEAHPYPWRVHNDWIVDSNQRNVVQKPSAYRGEWEIIASQIVLAMNRKDEEVPF